MARDSSESSLRLACLSCHVLYSLYTRASFEVLYTENQRNQIDGDDEFCATALFLELCADVWLFALVKSSHAAAAMLAGSSQ